MELQKAGITIFVLTGALLLNMSSTYAAMLILKADKVVKGTILEKTGEAIIMDVAGIPTKFALEDIAIIEEAGKMYSPVSATKSPPPYKPTETASTVAIRINPMVELNFKTKKEIYEIRKSCVFEHPELIQGDYSPSESVFGRIEDKKPWWGILGLSFYGPGNSSINGPSEESRFLVNPFLLIGLDNSHALIVSSADLLPAALYPNLLRLEWAKDRSAAKAKYEVNSYWEKLAQYHDPTANEHQVYLSTYNAQDFGFRYLYIDAKKSRNILLSQANLQLMPLNQFIHCGGSCGYPGGCNNMSPINESLLIRVNSTPALLSIKLWKNNPKNGDQPADMEFSIDMI